MIYTLTLNPAIDRELTIAEFAYDQVIRANAVQIDFGGKGFNVSRALAALGMESIALGFVGGATGEVLTKGLAGLGIRSDFVQIAGETRTNTSVVTKDHDRYLKVNEAGPVISAVELEKMLAKIRALARPGDWWVMAGSLPPGVPPTVYADATRIVQSTGASVILDTSGEPLRAGCAAQAFLIKPNSVEAGDLAGKPVHSLEDAFAVVDQIHALGAQQIVISLGKVGGIYSDGRGSWLAIPPQIVERNPIGAGDALVAGLAWGLSHGFSGSEVLRLGVACGAAAASLDGTAMGSRSLVERLAGQVEIKERVSA